MTSISSINIFHLFDAGDTIRKSNSIDGNQLCVMQIQHISTYSKLYDASFPCVCNRYMYIKF